MNVLPLIFSFIALITILTYARLSGFVVSKAVHQEYEQFIKKVEEELSLKTAVKKYHKCKVKEGGQASQKVQAYRTLNLFHLFEKEGKRTLETIWIFKNLISALFKESPFYKEALSQNPQILDEMIGAMREAFEDQKLKDNFKIGDLATLELNRPDLQFFLYKLLKDPEGVEEEEEEKMVEKEAAKILNELLTFNKKELPLRVYLADRTLLEAVFGDERVVDNIVAARKNYYNLVKKDPNRKEALSHEFESLFMGAVPPMVLLSSLNWEVSGTAPDKNMKSAKEAKKVYGTSKLD